MVAASNATALMVDELPRDEFVMNAWSNTADCNLDVAQRVSFVDLAAHPEELVGKCVAVEGYWTERALFGSAKDARTRLSNTTDRFRGKRVGLYARWDSIGKPPERPTRTMFVGRVGQCETQWPGAMMVMGYCHYSGGSILLVAQAFRS